MARSNGNGSSKTITGFLSNVNYSGNVVHLSMQTNVNGVKTDQKISVPTPVFLQNPFTVGQEYTIQITPSSS